MRLTLTELVVQLARVERVEVQSWVEHGWLRPAHDADSREVVFADVDLARAQLICELRHDLGVEEATLPLVLDLLDQLYTVRRRMNRLTEAVQEQPDDVRQAILARLGEPR
jgi:chaperone modulatory protein CbpM